MDSENRKIYHEYFALGILRLYSDYYSTFEKKEAPDLQSIDGICGIEVTMLSINESKHTDDLFNKYRNSSGDTRESLLEKIQKLGKNISYKSTIPVLEESGGYNGCKSVFVELLTKKISKVINYSKACRDISLFIQFDALCHNDIDNFVGWINECPDSHKFISYFLYFEMYRELYKYQDGKLSLVLEVNKDDEYHIKEQAFTYAIESNIT